MGAKGLIFLISVMVLISSCSTDKTKPVVTDIMGNVVGEVKQEAPKAEETAVKNETVAGEATEEEETTGENAEETETTEEKEEESLPLGTNTITIKDLKLEPKELTIKRGDTVIWKHEDTSGDEENKHYLAAHNNEFRTPILYYGDTFEHTFNKTGTFTYIDVLYRDRENLRGTIIVE